MMRGICVPHEGVKAGTQEREERELLSHWIVLRLIVVCSLVDEGAGRVELLEEEYEASRYGED